MPGSRYWARSYVQLSDGRKFFLSEYFSTLKDLMNDNKPNITIRQAKTIADCEIVLKKSNIISYGEYSFFI